MGLRVGWTRSWPLALVLLLTWAMPAHSQTTSPRYRLYDDFRGPLLDPARWQGWYSCGPTSLECRREVREGALALRVRGYGGLGGDSGSEYANASISLTNSAVTAIAATVRVNATGAAACPTNPDGAHGQATISGAFFKGGDGGDVNAYLQLDRYSTDPVGKVLVGAFLSSPSGFFGNVFLGTVNVGEVVTVQLIWDPSNHQFLSRLFRPLDGTSVEQAMPYPMVEAGPPANPQKTIGANAFVPNCSTSAPRPFAEMSVSILKVLTATQ